MNLTWKPNDRLDTWVLESGDTHIGILGILGVNLMKWYNHPKPTLPIEASSVEEAKMVIEAMVRLEG